MTVLEDMRWSLAYARNEWPDGIEFRLQRAPLEDHETYYFMWMRKQEVVCIHNNFASDAPEFLWALQMKCLDLIVHDQLRCQNMGEFTLPKMDWPSTDSRYWR